MLVSAFAVGGKGGVVLVPCDENRNGYLTPALARAVGPVQVGSGSDSD